jgi:hypothetical protein
VVEAVLAEFHDSPSWSVRLTVHGELRKTRLFRSHDQAERVGAIADTRTMFEGKGWA